MKTKKIRQTVMFAASPKAVYDLIMDARKHASFSGQKVTISNKVDGKFEVFGGYAHGRNLELKEGKKIVQAWHFAEDGWPDDHFSTCTFEFSKAPAGTKLTFMQTDIPEHKAEALKDGWKEYYWEPMKKHLAKSGRK